MPIHLSTSFVFDDSAHVASLFNMKRSGHVCSRIGNPTNAVLEEPIAALEGGSGAIATASGQAALHLAIASLAGAGSHIVPSSALYRGSHGLLHDTLLRFGIATTFVKPGDIDGWRAAIRPETRLLFGEPLGNPGLDVLDIPTVSAIAHDADLHGVGSTGRTSLEGLAASWKAVCTARRMSRAVATGSPVWGLGSSSG